MTRAVTVACALLLIAVFVDGVILSPVFAMLQISTSIHRGSISLN